MPKKRISRPLFRRGETYVTLRPVRMTDKLRLEPGEVINLPSHRLRSLYNRRRIGPKGHPWTEAILKSKGYPLGVVTEVDEDQVDEDQVDEDQVDEDQVEQDQETVTEQPEPIKDGSRWVLPGLTDEKFTSKKKAVEWLEAQSDDNWLEEGDE
ncbi:hypothetical protein P67b_00086 [Ruegeria phage Tedan]|nr:hypothetical protein P67b_00086 [Ruegeria phage Tedan]